jgi:hypothetical protein
MGTRSGYAGIGAALLGAAVAGALAGCSTDSAGISNINRGSGGVMPAGGSGGAAGAGGSRGDAGAIGSAGAGGAIAMAGMGGGYAPPAGVWWIVDGGDAASGRASGGGAIRVVAQGAVTLGAAPAPPPPLPALPADALIVDSAGLGADVTAVGAIRIDGHVVAGGAGATRQITSSAGDIFVSGDLRGGDDGGVARALRLEAPNGAVYVTGTIDTAGTAAGQGGGAIVLVARRVVVTGALSANGKDGPMGGGAGAVTVTATDLVFLGGPVQARGGAGTIAGGSGGQLVVNTAGAVQAAHLVDARGGAGIGGGAIAGPSGGIRIGEQTAPLLVNVCVPVFARGGLGGVVGGKGGTVTLEPQAGNLVIAGSVDLGGGTGTAQPGEGGTLLGVAGAGLGDRAGGGGDILLVGRIAANGGGITPGGSGNGAVAGVVTIESLSPPGALTVDRAAAVTLNGGASGGAGIAGGGGRLSFTTGGGDLTMAGKLSLRGGDARDAGGSGGLGGAVDLSSDANGGGLGGNLLIDTTGVIDASGGAGTIGGSARSNGGEGVASFSDGMEQIAVLINCDRQHGTTDSWLENRGLIVARGGAANGNGGDIVYHGISPDRNTSPPAGNIDSAGNGMGKPGDFSGQ